MNSKLEFDITISDEGIPIFKKTSMSRPIVSGWVKVIPDHCKLPFPSAVEYPSHIPGRIITEDIYIPSPDEIIIEGYVFETLRGKNGKTIYPWNYRISGADFFGNFFSLEDDWIGIKTKMRAQGMEKTLLEGKNPLAALVRIAHGIRLGMTFKDLAPTREAALS